MTIYHTREQSLLLEIQSRGMLIEKLGHRICNQRRHIRALHEAIRIAAATEITSDELLRDAHRALDGAKAQMQKMIAHNQHLRSENTRLQDRNVELEVLHNMADKESRDSD